MRPTSSKSPIRSLPRTLRRSYKSGFGLWRDNLGESGPGLSGARARSARNRQAEEQPTRKYPSAAILRSLSEDG
jgi:hypothetical protein